MNLVSFSSLHDFFVVLISLLSFYGVGHVFLHGQTMYGVRKHTYSEELHSSFSQGASVVFTVTLMIGCAVLEIFTFDLVGYLQPAVRLGVWRVLISLLGVLVNVVVPAMLSASLCASRIHPNQPSLGLKGLILHELNMRNVTVGALGVIVLQGVVWVLLEVLPLRLEEAPISWGVLGLRLSSVLGFVLHWSADRTCLAAAVLGTCVAAVLGGFAAVHFPLDVYLVSKYAGRVTRSELAKCEAHLRDSLQATRARSQVMKEGHASGTSLETLDSRPPPSSRSGSGNGSIGVFRRSIASPAKTAHSHEASPYFGRPSPAIQSELSLLSQIEEETQTDLEVLDRLRSQDSRAKSLLGRAENVYGLVLSLWGAIRVVIGACRVAWWLCVTLVFAEGNSPRLSTEITENVSRTSDFVVDELLTQPAPLSLWNLYLPTLYVLAVVAMVFLQMKSFLQSVRLLAKLGFALKRADVYSLILAQVSGWYCLACLLFVRAFALLLTDVFQWLGIGSGGENGHALGVAIRQSTALDIAMGIDINFDLLFRIFDMVFVNSTLFFLAFLWFNFQRSIRSIDSFLEKNAEGTASVGGVDEYGKSLYRPADSLYPV